LVDLHGVLGHRGATRCHAALFFLALNTPHSNIAIPRPGLCGLCGSAALSSGVVITLPETLEALPYAFE
jgi:hypothetical protein